MKGISLFIGVLLITSPAWAQNEITTMNPILGFFMNPFGIGAAPVETTTTMAATTTTPVPTTTTMTTTPVPTTTTAAGPTTTPPPNVFQSGWDSMVNSTASFFNSLFGITTTDVEQEELEARVTTTISPIVIAPVANAAPAAVPTTLTTTTAIPTDLTTTTKSSLFGNVASSFPISTITESSTTTSTTTTTTKAAPVPAAAAGPATTTKRSLFGDVVSSYPISTTLPTTVTTSEATTTSTAWTTTASSSTTTQAVPTTTKEPPTTTQSPTTTTQSPTTTTQSPTTTTKSQITTTLGPTTSTSTTLAPSTLNPLQQGWNDAMSGVTGFFNNLFGVTNQTDTTIPTGPFFPTPEDLFTNLIATIQQAIPQLIEIVLSLGEHLLQISGNAADTLLLKPLSHLLNGTVGWDLLALNLTSVDTIIPQLIDIVMSPFAVLQSVTSGGHATFSLPKIVGVYNCLKRIVVAAQNLFRNILSVFRPCLGTPVNGMLRMMLHALKAVDDVRFTFQAAADGTVNCPPGHVVMCAATMVSETIQSIVTAGTKVAMHVGQILVLIPRSGVDTWNCVIGQTNALILAVPQHLQALQCNL